MQNLQEKKDKSEFNVTRYIILLKSCVNTYFIP